MPGRDPLWYGKRSNSVILVVVCVVVVQLVFLLLTIIEPHFVSYDSRLDGIYFYKYNANS